MAGWNHKKRLIFEQSFYDFLGQCWVNSRDAGPICLGDNLFDAQKIFFKAVFDGLEEDIHIFDVLKSRQLGISTIARALSVYWQGMHDGLPGACVFDTDFNKQNARREIETMIRDLPSSLEFPGIKSSNRNSLVLENDSVVSFLAAGVKKSKSSGTLGRSLGLAAYTASELCSYDNDEGWEAFDNSKSEIHPNRLYIRESTARGFNSWHELWVQDRADTAHCKCVFLGWWSKNSQIIRKTEPDFSRYGLQPPNEIELKKIEEVKKLYGHQITQEQLAWVRRKMNPTLGTDSDDAVDYQGNVVRVQEQPFTESDAFQFTGATFFSPENLKEITDKYVNKSYKSYMFGCGVEFTDTRVYPSPNKKMTELKVWEEPEGGNAIYVVACDPAYGSDERNDRSAIQVLRCYADGCDQVAEYAWPLIGTKQLAWALLAIAGWYAGDQNEVYLIVELNGPGTPVWDEIQYLKTHITAGYQPKAVDERGLKDVFRNVRNYVYSRPDAMSQGKSWMWKTSGGAGPSGKVRLMERLRDSVSNLQLRIRSLDTVEEMRSITREGDSIAAQGSKKDDRVMSLALAIRCWEERVRRSMAVLKRTRDFEEKRRVLTLQDRVKLFTSHQFTAFFDVKRQQRMANVRAIRRAMRGR